jgi:hypothetical protein
MRRASRVKQSGAQRDWTSKRFRRLAGLSDRPGRGKFSKRELARKQRRQPTRDRDDD